MMTALDGTIAVIALPRIQSGLAASQEQIAWVLTSYLIAAAIATPLSGWLANRFGRGRVMALSILGFTLSSIGCGLSANLEMLVLFRCIQGATGASLVPLSQVLLLDINPPERHGPAIALFGIGTMVGPMIGPTLGGWLTEYFSWRWIFLINAPIGLLSFVGLKLFVPRDAKVKSGAFDLKGFVAVSLCLTSLQLTLDRGQMLDWFSSTEICIEAGMAVIFFYISVVHILTAREPFIKPAIFRDRNFLLGTMLAALIGVFLIGVVPIMTSMMQQLLGFPVILTGMLAMPRAVGNIITIVFIGRIVSKVDARWLILLGMAIQICSLYMLTIMSLDTSPETMAWIGFLQGCGSGFLFLPLTLAVFSTLPHEFRNEGSTLFALTRNLGGAIGISVLQVLTIRDTATAQSRLVESIRPDNPLVAWRLPDFDMADTASIREVMGEVVRQATMVAYVDAFHLLLAVAIVAVPLCLLMRSSRPSNEPAPIIHVE
jgi:DHA2 family multidrug resistance protein